VKTLSRIHPAAVALPALILMIAAQSATAALQSGTVQSNPGDEPPSPIVATGGDLLETAVSSVAGETTGAKVRNGLTGTASENSADNPAIVWGQSSTTFHLDLTQSPYGYEITEFRAFSGWTNRASQSYRLYYSLAGDPAFHQIGSDIVADLGANPCSVMTRTFDDAGAGIASNVDAIRIVPFDGPAAYDGTGTVFREFDLFGSPSLTEPPIPPAEPVVTQSGPDPIAITPGQAMDDLVVLMAAASEHNENLATDMAGASYYPKHFWIGNWDDDTADFMKWRISLAEEDDYRVFAKLSSGAVIPLTLKVEGSGNPLTFSTRSIGWDRLDAGVIRIPAGISKLALTRDTSAGGNIKIKSLELIRESDYPAYQQRVAAFRADNTWFRESKYGVMFQMGSWGFPPSGPAKSPEDFANEFDVPKFVAMVKGTGAAYVIWSITWWNYRMSAPVSSVDGILGNGDRTSTRDLIGEIAAALKEENIRFMLYYHTGHDGHLGYGSTDWWSAQQFPAAEFNQRGTGDRSAFFNNWISVITELGTRYGNLLDGWFFDDGMVYYPAPFERLGQAAKAGNSSRLVSWNSWIAPRETEFQDVWMGEGHKGGILFGSSPAGGNGTFTDGPLAGLLEHGMFMMEQDWGVRRANQPINATSITPGQAMAWVNSASARGVPLSFNLMMWEDQTLSQPSLDVLSSLKTAIRDAPATFGGNLVINGGFEAPVTSSHMAYPAGSLSIPGWQVSSAPGDGVQIAAPGLLGSSNGTQNLQLTGGSSYNSGGGIRQILTTIPGDSYRVRFDIASRNGAAANGEIVFGGESRPLSAASSSYFSNVMEFTASESSTVLEFIGSPVSSSRQLLIDNVSVLALEADFSRWRSANFIDPADLENAAVSGPLASPAGDGMPNLLKYAFGRPPFIPASVAPLSPLPAGGGIGIRYQRPSNRRDLVYLVESSGNLVDWTPDGMVQSLVHEESGMESWEAVLPESPRERRFFRLNVSRQ